MGYAHSCWLIEVVFPNFLVLDFSLHIPHTFIAVEYLVFPKVIKTIIYIECSLLYYGLQFATGSLCNLLVYVVRNCIQMGLRKQWIVWVGGVVAEEFGKVLWVYKYARAICIHRNDTVIRLIILEMKTIRSIRYHINLTQGLFLE